MAKELSVAVSGSSFGKNSLENETGHRGIEEKIVPLDRSAYRRGDDSATEFTSMLVWGKRVIDIGYRCHCRSLS
jgi:hypothetical protein